MNRAIDHVLADPAAPLRLADLAKAAHLSPFHFHRVFQAVTGETPADFVKRLRLERALARMALPGRAPLSRVALDCGFASPSDFTRSFRQRFGVAPSRFDLAGWQAANRERLPSGAADLHADALPEAGSADGFAVRLVDLPPRTVAYVRVADPYHGDGVAKAAGRLVAWAEREGCAEGEWLGFQWDNPEVVPLEQCRYHVGVVAPGVKARGEIGRFDFPAMRVAQVEVKGGIDLEIRALFWLYGAWLPRSGTVPDDHPCFESWIGRPFAHGYERFELNIQLPVRRG